MEFTGERFIPTEQGEIRLEHYHRYATVLAVVAGKDVLDVACGEGYGSYLMAEVARSVTGVDISEEAIRHAGKTYNNRTNLMFRHDGATALHLADASFDVVVSFETLEHVAGQSEMLAEIRRVLRPDGVLILSSPNRPVYSRASGNPNSFHVKELDFSEFDALLRTHFPAVQYLGQRLMIGSIIQPLDESQGSFRAWQDDGAGLRPGSGRLPDPVYFLAACAAHESLLPALEASILHPVQLDLLKQYQGYAQWAKESNRELDDLRRQYVQLDQEHRKVGAWAQTLVQKVDELQKTNQELSGRSDEIRRNCQEHSKIVQLLDQELNAMRRTLSWRITSPLRFIRHHLTRLQSAAGRGWRHGVWAPLRRTYHRLPLAPNRKLALQSWFYRRLPGLFSGLPSYEGWKLREQAAKGLPPLRRRSVSRPNQLDMKRVVSANPLASIVIPVFGKLDYTLCCLQSIEQLKTSIPFEVIVVDDCSPDSTATTLTKIPRVRIVSNLTNQGFIRSCNAGAAVASGEFLVFLNNDTEVLDGWLDALLDTFFAHPTTGLVGSKLLYPDGRLQEAGGIVWNDATGWNFGRLDDPSKPEYNYVRDVDYCSGASIAIRKELFDQLGGFDERYVPAYFEDADLAFAVRRAGYRVLYQPASQLIHYEGITSGTDLGSGAKAFQVVNRGKFLEKWAHELANHHNPGEAPFLARDRLACGRILIVDATTPTPDQDAGSVTAHFYQKIFTELGYKVTFAPDNLATLDGYTQDLQQLGVECLYAPHVPTLNEYLKEHGAEFDFVMLYRVWIANNHIQDVKRYCSKAKIIFDTVDLHYLREERQAALTGSAEMVRQAERTKATEIGLMREVDATIVLSEAEAELLHQQDASLPLATIPLLLEISGSRNPFTRRKDLVFIGGFEHSPNIDAVEYFVEAIWPLVRPSLPGAQFLIIGSKMPECIKALEQNEGVVAVGFVQDLAEYFNCCKLTVVPLRYGAGIKGKIGTSASYGVPSVATSIATEGMGLVDGENVLVADTAGSFAEKIISLYNDESLWNKLSRGALDFVTELYSLEAGKERLVKLLRSLGGDPQVDLELARVDSLEAFSRRRTQLATVFSARRVFESSLLAPDYRPFSVQGFCRVCCAPQSFKVDYVTAYCKDEQGILQPNWRETLVCERCGQNNRVRAATDLFTNVLRPSSSSRIYVTEQLTSFYGWLKNAFPSAVGSEFLGAGVTPGSMNNGLRHEDLTHLSFEDKSFDFILSFDVLEHVPNYHKALVECTRCLAEDGLLLLSVPFLAGSQDTLVRAQITENRQVEHLLPPEYHGNPTLPNEGSLCFYHFGWDLLDTIKSHGFRNTFVQTVYSQRYGYLGEEQIFVVARK